MRLTDACPHLALRAPCLLLLLRRYANIEAMDETERGNKLPYPPASSIEYAVHGHYRRRPDDINGIYGTWWVDIAMLLEALGGDKDELNTLLEQFEHDQAEARAEAVEEACAAAQGEAEVAAEAAAEAAAE